MIATAAKLILAILALAVAALVAARLLYESKVRNIWRALGSPGPRETFTEEMVSTLPEAATRYLLRAIRPGTPLARSVTLKMSGSFRGSPAMGWMAMRGREILRVPEGFVWRVGIASGKLGIGGADYFFGREGASRFFYAGIMPVVNAKGHNISRSSAGRVACEAVLLPSSLLPSRGVSWEAVDANSAKAVFHVAGETVQLTIHVNRAGRLLSAVVMRWGRTEDIKGYGYIPFGAKFAGERSFGGYTIPHQIGAGWHFGTEDYFEFFRASIDEAEFR